MKRPLASEPHQPPINGSQFLALAGRALDRGHLDQAADLLAAYRRHREAGQATLDHHDQMEAQLVDKLADAYIDRNLKTGAKP